MIANVLYLLLFIAPVITLEDNHLMQHTTGDILCRACGIEVSSSTSIFSNPSTLSRYTFNDTLFNKDDVLVQVFTTDIFFSYPVIALHSSTCIPTGEWEESTSWYPGYRWRPCTCPECGTYIGFVFEPINPGLVTPSNTFYGLILTSLISKDSGKYIYIDMATTDTLSDEDKEYLAKCEEEFKDRFTEKDEDFMKVFNEEPSTPPVLDSWWVPNSGRRNDRRSNRRNHPYQRDGNRDRNYDRRDNRGYNDYNRSHDDRGSGYRQRHRYHY